MEIANDDCILIEQLTPREIEIVTRLTRGERVSTIVANLDISRSTVRTHLASIFSKLGVHSQAELVAFARSHDGLTGQEDEGVEIASLRSTIDEANERFFRALSDARQASDPVPGIKRALRNYLPLEDRSRMEWTARLAYWAAVAQGRVPEGSELRKALRERATRLAHSRLGREALADGRTPDQVVDELALWVFAASVRMLSEDDPEVRRRYLARCDSLIEELRPKRAS